MHPREPVQNVTDRPLTRIEVLGRPATYGTAHEAAWKAAPCRGDFRGLRTNPRCMFRGQHLTFVWPRPRPPARSETSTTLLADAPDHILDGWNTRPANNRATSPTGTRLQHSTRRPPSMGSPDSNTAARSHTRPLSSVATRSSAPPSTGWNPGRALRRRGEVAESLRPLKVQDLTQHGLYGLSSRPATKDSAMTAESELTTSTPFSTPTHVGVGQGKIIRPPEAR